MAERNRSVRRTASLLQSRNSWRRTEVSGIKLYDVQGKDGVVRVLASVRACMDKAAEAHGLTYKSLGECHSRNYVGLCYDSGAINLMVREHQRPTKLRPWKAVLATAMHELAHTRHFDHGADFKALERELVAFAKAQGWFKKPPHTHTA